jgi:hypothetical protein
MSTPKSKTATATHSSHRASRSRSSAAKPAAHRSATSRVAAPAVKKALKVATKLALARRVLAKVKSKTGLAIAAGVVLAGVGLARKYRAAH